MGKKANEQNLIDQLKSLGVYVSNETEAKLNLSFINYLKKSNDLKQKLVIHLQDLEPENLSSRDRQTLELLQHLIID